jgi:hypothetical protein
LHDLEEYMYKITTRQFSETVVDFGIFFSYYCMEIVIVIVIVIRTYTLYHGYESPHRHSSLCALAIPCNLPELQSEKDLVWIYEKLCVNMSDEEASEHFRKTLDIALSTRFTRLNDATHMLAHA